MGPSYLIDTNVVIDLIGGKLPESGGKWLDNLFVTHECYLSIINKIELLGFSGPSSELDTLRAFVNDITVLPMTDTVADKAIEIRSKKKMKLPDAIVAATAVVHNLAVISRNTKDFTSIEGLEVVNPYDK